MDQFQYDWLHDNSKVDHECCGVPMILQSKHSGLRGCDYCFREDTLADLVTPESDFKFVRSEDGKCNEPRASFPSQKRVSEPINNFRRVVSVFFGQQLDSTPAELVKKLRRQVDVADPLAYTHIRQWMKTRKQYRRYYNCIFEIIYRLGGVKPSEASRHVPRIEIEYTAMCEYFDEIRATEWPGRHSILNSWMMLEHILKRFQ